MWKKLFIPVSMLIATPALAHQGLGLDSFVHQVLHRVGTDNVIAIGAVGVLVSVLALWRALVKGRAGSDPAGLDSKV